MYKVYIYTLARDRNSASEVSFSPRAAAHKQRERAHALVETSENYALFSSAGSVIGLSLSPAPPSIVNNAK